MCGTIYRVIIKQRNWQSWIFQAMPWKDRKVENTSLRELSCQMCQSAGREQKHQQRVQITIFIFLLNEIRGGVWLVWHRNCQPLTLQGVRSEHSSCCLPRGIQELVQVSEIWGWSIIKNKVTGKHWSPHWTDFSETLRKPLILVISCKNRRWILKSLHWWGMLFSAVRLHCLQQSEMGLRRWCQASAFSLLLCSFVVF